MATSSTTPEIAKKHCFIVKQAQIGEEQAIADLIEILTKKCLINLKSLARNNVAVSEDAVTQVFWLSVFRKLPRAKTDLILDDYAKSDYVLYNDPINWLAKYSFLAARRHATVQITSSVYQTCLVCGHRGKLNYVSTVGSATLYRCKKCGNLDQSTMSTAVVETTLSDTDQTAINDVGILNQLEYKDLIVKFRSTLNQHTRAYELFNLLLGDIKEESDSPCSVCNRDCLGHRLGFSRDICKNYTRCIATLWNSSPMNVVHHYRKLYSLLSSYLKRENHLMGGRIDELSQQILKHRRLYYVGSPVVSDASYDELEQELAHLAPDHKLLMRVGSTPTSDMVQHDPRTPMLSLDKIHGIDELVEWCSDKGAEFTAEAKIDGLAISIIYIDGKYAYAAKRGDGHIGQLVPYHLPCFPDTINSFKNTDVAEIRGECYMKESVWADHFADQSNSRNTVAGLLNKKEFVEGHNYLEFIAHDLILSSRSDLSFTIKEKYSILDEAGFKIPYQVFVDFKEHEGKERTEYLSAIVAIFINIRKSLDYAIDGIVFKINNGELRNSWGSTRHHPKWAIAWKFPAEVYYARLSQIAWQTGRTGKITPVGILEPITIDNVLVGKCTLHNPNFLRIHRMSLGDSLIIIRANDVIPKCLGVHSRADESRGIHDFITIPSTCPVCGAKTEYYEPQVYCVNPECDAKHFGRLQHFIKVLKIDGIGDSVLNAMRDYHDVCVIPDIFRWAIDLPIKVKASIPIGNGILGESRATKLTKEIDLARTVTLDRFLYSLGIPHLGESMSLRMSPWLYKQAPNAESLIDYMKTLLDCSPEDLLGADIEGMGEIKAKAIVANLQQQRGVIESLCIYMSVKDIIKPVSGLISGKKFCITGTLSIPRQEIKELIKQHGGTMTSSISKDTYLVIGNNPGSKHQKAIDKGATILTEDELREML